MAFRRQQASRPSAVGEVSEDCVELPAKRRDVSADHLTDDGRIDVEVRMSQNHSGADDVSPRDLRMRRLDLGGHFRGSFAEHLDPSLRGRLNDRVHLHTVRIRSMLQDQVAHLDHVEYEIAVFSHSSTASANTRSATRPKARLGGDIDVATEELLEIHEQPPKVKQPALVVQLDQEVDIAGGG